jgi:HlyD family secretion protein
MCEYPKARTICFIALAGTLHLSIGCTSSTPPEGASSSATPGAGVTLVHPQRKSLVRVVEQPGTIQAQEETLLYARIPGYVRRLRPEIDIGYRIRGPKYDSSGKEIEPGEVLAVLAVPELEQEAKQKGALVDHAEAQVDQAVKALAAAEAGIAVAQAMIIETQSNYERWDSESKRMAGLTKNGIVNSQAGEETFNQFRAAAGRLASAKAAVQKARADRDTQEADVRAAKFRVGVFKADALRSEAMLGYARIRAPYDGIVTRRKVNTGDLVQPTNGHGDWLFTVARLDTVRVVIAVPEADAGLVRDKAEVRITIQAVPGPALIGTVARTSWALEPDSRTLRAEIELPNKEGFLRPGMYVNAQIINRLPEEWTLPVSAVVKQGNSTVCFLIENGKSVRTPVQIGRSDGQLVQVLRWQKPGKPPVWQEFTGTEVIAGQAAGLTDGQALQGDAAGK